ncbi:hypothetical protein [Streptomyces sp. UNOB3_S3]|uniref:hypothetical protein n=1 Tax=Streptomyces sp. UNOB3_S3 TaxID=2871682 RepID=UPI001E57DD56|nr:hypothetical protein [Streptomyces sp. UNOB3_S3]MCC3777821.1 hypothetical protein [Streptomyces sp. UNOB3_S3]
MTGTHAVPPGPGPAGGFPEVLDQLVRITPARAQDTYGGLRAAQRLVVAAAGPCAAPATTREQGERQVYAGTLARAVRVPVGERRAPWVTLMPPAAN